MPQNVMIISCYLLRGMGLFTEGLSYILMICKVVSIVWCTSLCAFTSAAMHSTCTQWQENPSNNLKEWHFFPLPTSHPKAHKRNIDIFTYIFNHPSISSLCGMYFFLYISNDLCQRHNSNTLEFQMWKQLECLKLNLRWSQW